MTKRWAVLAAVPVFVGLSWFIREKLPARSAQATTQVGPESEGRIAALESHMARLNAELRAERSAPRPAPVPERPAAEEAENGQDADRARGDVEEAEAAEDVDFEAAEREADAILQGFDQRFEAEPIDPEWSARRESDIRGTLTVGKFASLVRSVSCKWTMCRLEFATSDASIQDLLSASEIQEGGYGRKKPDGSVVLLTGRETYPFHQVNAID